MNKTHASAVVLVWFGASAVIYDFLDGVSDYDVTPTRGRRNLASHHHPRDLLRSW
jgi:hypothetical protein